MMRRPLVYDFLCENVYNEKVDNPYAIRFAKDPLIKSFRVQHSDKWRSLLNKNTLKKEATECYGVVNLVVELCEKLKSRLEKAKTIVFFDMCSGKGYTSVVLFATLPEWIRSKCKIVMLDKATKMNLDHLDTLKHTIEFQHFCIYPEKKNGTQKLMNDLTKILKKFGEPGTDVVGICIGVHLCIYLSEIFISVFNQMDSLLGMALSPCCLHETDENRQINEMCKDSSIFEDAQISGMSREVIQYMGWTFFLHSKIHGDSNQVFKKMVHDELVLSDRNNFLMAYKLQQHTESETIQ